MWRLDFREKIINQHKHQATPTTFQISQLFKRKRQIPAVSSSLMLEQHRTDVPPDWGRQVSRNVEANICLSTVSF